MALLKQARQKLKVPSYTCSTGPAATIVCISNFTPRPGRKMSAVVGWVNVKDWSIPHLKALTVTFKLM